MKSFLRVDVNVGSMIAFVRGDPFGGALFIDELFVHAAHRHRGLASALVHASCALAIDMGLPRVQFAVLSSNGGTSTLQAAALHRHD